MIKFPSFITHYSRGAPFLSFTAMGRETWSELIKDLNETNAWGLSRFSDPNYLEDRLIAEKKIREEFISKGGKPELDHPIYFFLGRHKGFESHKSNVGYAIDLKDIAVDSVSFTYGDSMLAYIEKNRLLSGEEYQNSLCGSLYRIDCLKELFSHADFPKESPLSIEAQLWVLPKKEIVKNLDYFL